MNGPIRLRQGGRFEIFIIKNLHFVQIFYDKDKSVPCCRRRNRFSGLASGRNRLHRVTPVNNTSYAIVDLAGACRDNRPDLPPAGWKIPFFFTKMLHRVQHFCEKDKMCTMLPQAILPFTG
jgi:hypothetical protein